MDKIVICNGSYANRQETISAIANHFQGRGYSVYIVGSIYSIRTQVESCDHNYARRIERFANMSDKILQEAKTFEDGLLSAKKDENIIVIYNGGICDLEAYAKPENEEDRKILKKKLIGNAKEMNYSLCLQLCAYGSMDFGRLLYSTTKEQAKELEKAIYECWQDSRDELGIDIERINGKNFPTNIEFACMVIEDYLFSKRNAN